MSDSNPCPTNDALPGEIEELAEPLEPPIGPEALVPGTVLGRPEERSYSIARWMRCENQANLYEAVASGDDHAVWVREASGEMATALLRYEADVLRELECPMFPALLGMFEQNGRTYLATHAADGETLAEALVRRSLSPRRVISTLAQVAFALTKLHASGWVHLGLRPEIIVLGRPVKILDLSYATRIGEKMSQSFYLAGYSAPELLAGDAANPAADIYSVGALLFRAVGREPIPETGPDLHCWQPEDALPGVPQILHRCLGPTESRFKSAATLHQELLRLARRLAPRPVYSWTAVSSIGLEPARTTNQDAYGFASGQLSSEEEASSWSAFCVADGMGGMAAGEVASRLAAGRFLDEVCRSMAGGRVPAPEEQGRRIREWIQAANDSVYAGLEALGARGGATFLCGCFCGDRLAIGHVGDSRIYRIRGEEATLLTRDHSVAMTLVRQGELSLEDVRGHPDRNSVTRSLGDRKQLPDALIDTLATTTGEETAAMEKGDVLLLCTDGVWETVLEEEMVRAVREREPDLHASAQAIVRAALDRGGHDNATLLLVRLDEQTDM